MSTWKKTISAGVMCYDAVDNKFFPGDMVAYIKRGSIHTGRVHKINVNECGQIYTCWITPEPEFKHDASRKAMYKYGPWYRKTYNTGYTCLIRDVIETIKTEFYNDCLIPVSKIIKIVPDTD